MNEPNAGTSKTIKGIPASPGIAIGKVVCVDNKRRKVLPRSIQASEIESQLAQFQRARDTIVAELGDMLNYLKTESSAIIETQKQIVIDIEIEKRVSAAIREELLSCDFAVYRTFCDFIERLKESGSELFQQRIIDLENLKDRFIDVICGNEASLEIEAGTILVTKELSPTELVSLHEKGLSGLVMEKGGVTSHAVLIAQSLDIPCVVNAKDAIKRAANEKAVLNGREGILILEPGKNELKVYQTKLRKLKKTQKRLLKNISEPSVSKSGTEFLLAANIEFESEIKFLKKYNAGHIGLLRTEGLLFSNKISYEEQTGFYESVLKGVDGTVTFRLFDVGGDKLNAKLPQEANPFLGWRGIRMLLDEENLLENQLKAILTCAGKNKGRVKILIPMISILEEVRAVKNVVQRIQNELSESGTEIDEHVAIGAMIEVPGAALHAEQLAAELDFMSIGTNDLTQYTLAVDRGNEKISGLYQQQHPSIWKLIKATAEAAHKVNTELAVCGELAGDVLGACGLFGMGIKNLSMIASSIPKVKEELISHTDEEFKQFADICISAATTTQIKEAFEDWRIH